MTHRPIHCQRLPQGPITSSHLVPLWLSRRPSASWEVGEVQTLGKVSDLKRGENYFLPFSRLYYSSEALLSHMWSTFHSQSAHGDSITYKTVRKSTKFPFINLSDSIKEKLCLLPILSTLTKTVYVSGKNYLTTRYSDHRFLLTLFLQYAYFYQVVFFKHRVLA